MEWQASRQQMRRTEFRYNVLDEMVAYQRFEAEHAVFLVLHHVTEAEMLHAMHRAQQLANAGAAVATPELRKRSGFGISRDESVEPSPLALRLDESDGSHPSSTRSPLFPLGTRSEDVRPSSSLSSRPSPSSALVVKLLDDDSDDE